MFTRHYITTISASDVEDIFNEYNGDLKEYVKNTASAAIDRVEDIFEISVDDNKLVLDVDYGYADEVTTFDVMLEKTDG